VNARVAREAFKNRFPTGVMVMVCGLLGWFVVEGALGPDRGSPLVTGEPDHLDIIRGDSASSSSELRTHISALAKEGKELRTQLSGLKPRGAYVVVDRENNRIFLRRGDSVLVDAAASTGSGAVLKETSGQQRSWTFDTPLGRFPILAERGNPVWTKPDWAFLEAGEPIPHRISDRKDYGSLGEFALDLGDGYMIHGTLYERLLGRSVTHGCVRVGRDALRAIVDGTRVGTPVFIF
jgi:L,D-transpeptidase YbiS